MKLRHLMYRIFNGLLVGIGIGYTMAVIFSTIYGNFLPTPPTLVEKVGMLGAAQMNLVLSAFLGIIFSCTALVWDREDWSIFKKTLIYFSVNIITTGFAGYQMYWFPHSISGIIQFFIIFIVIFLIIWLIFHTIARIEANDLNKSLSKQKDLQ